MSQESFVTSASARTIVALYLQYACLDAASCAEHVSQCQGHGTPGATGTAQAARDA